MAEREEAKPQASDSASSPIEPAKDAVDKDLPVVEAPKLDGSEVETPPAIETVDETPSEPADKPADEPGAAAAPATCSRPVSSPGWRAAPTTVPAAGSARWPPPK